VRMKRIGTELVLAVNEINKSKKLLERFGLILIKAIDDDEHISCTLWSDNNSYWCHIMPAVMTQRSPLFLFDLGIRFEKPDELVITGLEIFIRDKYKSHWGTNLFSKRKLQKTLDLSDAGCNFFSLDLDKQQILIRDFVFVSLNQTSYQTVNRKTF